MRALPQAWLVFAVLFAAACGGGGPGDPRMLPEGERCASDVQCQSNHCDGEICCGSGSCCITEADCPDAYRSEPVCTTPGAGTDCQGTRANATCARYMCGTATVDDDRGCSGAMRSCGAYRDVACTASADQPVAGCPTSCTAPSDCADGYTCMDHACIAIAGAGQECAGTGQGSCSSPSLKCQNGVCCDASAATCCKDSTSCSNGLACNTTTFTCYTTCTNDDSGRCASPADHYCASNVCLARQAPGASCTGNPQCASGSCECFSASCTDRRCRSSWCGQCQIATSDTACTGGLGNPLALPDPDPADSCRGVTTACYQGACKKMDGQACGGNPECISGICRGGTCGAASGLKGPCDAGDGNADCQSGLVCDQGTCRYPLATEGCGADDQCQGGHCAQGVCCATTCGAGCSSCDVPGHVGTCYADNTRCGSCYKCDVSTWICGVEGAGEDVKGDCAHRSGVDCHAGTGCNGAGACRALADGTTCNDGTSCTQADVCTSGVCRGCTCGGACVGSTFEAFCADPDITGTWRCDFTGGKCVEVLLSCY